jgi:hypothetical protein
MAAASRTPAGGAPGNIWQALLQSPRARSTALALLAAGLLLAFVGTIAADNKSLRALRRSTVKTLTGLSDWFWGEEDDKSRWYEDLANYEPEYAPLNPRSVAVAVVYPGGSWDTGVVPPPLESLYKNLLGLTGRPDVLLLHYPNVDVSEAAYAIEDATGSSVIQVRVDRSGSCARTRKGRAGALT